MLPFIISLVAELHGGKPSLYGPMAQALITVSRFGQYQVETTLQ
jgi:hypothetical protein